MRLKVFNFQMFQLQNFLFAAISLALILMLQRLTILTLLAWREICFSWIAVNYNNYLNPLRLTLKNWLLMYNSDPSFFFFFSIYLAAPRLIVLWRKNSITQLNRCIYQLSIRRSPGASWRDWIPNPGRATSGDWSGNLSILTQRLNPLGRSPTRLLSLPADYSCFIIIGLTRREYTKISKSID